MTTNQHTTTRRLAIEAAAKTIAELESKATAGQWRLEEFDDGDSAIVTDADAMGDIVCRAPDEEQMLSRSGWADNADYLMACRNHSAGSLLLELLGMLGEVEGRISKLRERLSAQTNQTLVMASEIHRRVVAKLEQCGAIPEGLDPHGHPTEQVVGTCVSHLHSQLASLQAIDRDLCRVNLELTEENNALRAKLEDAERVARVARELVAGIKGEAVDPPAGSEGR